jgi:uncharacterized caspase-like protein
MSDSFSHGYALLIGVSKTKEREWSLPMAARDARAIRTIMSNPQLCAYDSDHIRLLTDAKASRENIRRGLAWLRDQGAGDPEATIVIYYSGHGWLDRSTKRYYMFCNETKSSSVDKSALAATEFTQLLRQIPAKRLLVILDCCHAEEMATAKGRAIAAKAPRGFQSRAIPKTIADQLKQGKGRAVFSSSRGTQSSWPCPGGSLSLFTFHLLEALRGAGNQIGDSEVRLSNLMNHLAKSVPDSAQKMNREQTPFFDTATEDFPVAVLRGGKGLPMGGWHAAQVDETGKIHSGVVAG